MVKKEICPRCGNEEVSENDNYCKICGLKIKKGAPEMEAQEQPKITFDFGVIGPSRFYITTDKSFYDGMKENPNFVPMFTPNDIKSNLHILWDLQLYIFHILQE